MQIISKWSQVDQVEANNYVAVICTCHRNPQVFLLCIEADIVLPFHFHSCNQNKQEAGISLGQALPDPGD